MGKILLHSLVALSSLMMMACGQGISTDVVASKNAELGTPNSPTPAPPPTPPPTPTPDGSITLAQLTGVWQGPCQPLDDQSMATRLTFTGANTVTGRSLVYAGSGCSGGAIIIVNMTGNFSILGLSRSVSKATDFNISVNQVTGTPQSSLVAGQLNFIQFCGYDDWDSGVAHSVSLNNSCLSDLPLKGNQIAEIANAKLYFGNSNRTAIDKSIGYTKQ